MPNSSHVPECNLTSLANKHKTSTIDEKGDSVAAFFVCNLLVLQIAGKDLNQHSPREGKAVRGNITFPTTLSFTENGITHRST
jgi:hypothetical protein